MKNFGWILSAILSACLIYCCAYVLMYKSEYEYQKKINEALKEENFRLEKESHNFDWLKDEIEAIDNYIAVVDQLKYSNRDIKYPELERTRDELNKERLEVIENAIYWDRVLQSREVEK